MVATTGFRRWFCLSVLVMGVMLAGCAPRTYLIVDYELPQGDYKLDGSQVRMQIRDMRKSKLLLTQTAAAEFEGFNDRYNLAWIQSDKTRQKVGNFDMEEMVGETFRKRLEMLGVHVMRSSLSSAPLFLVEVVEMQIDLKDHNWSAQMSCRITLEGEGGKTAHQEVIGSAQRPKILGRKGADTVLSELFTDVVNRVNIERLFEQADL